ETGDKAGGAADITPPKSCESSADCESGDRCNSEKVCEGGGGGGAPKKVWLSLNVQQDFGILSGQRDVCNTGASDTSQYTCLEDNGDYVYSGLPDPKGGNAITGGFKPATTRFLVGVDLLLSNNFTIGARVGYGLNTQLPKDGLHAEARFSYWIGKEPF